MRPLLTLILLTFLSASGYAADSLKLNLELLDRFKSAASELEAVSARYPQFNDLEPDLDQIILNKGKGMVELAKKHGAYSDLNGVIKKYGFESLSDYVEVLSRLMVGVSALEFAKQSPEEKMMMENMNIDTVRQQMVEGGVPPALIDAQLKEVEKMISMARVMKTATDNISEADLEFVKANQEAVYKAIQ